MKTKEEINSEINILLDALQDVGINTPTLRKLIDEYAAQATAEHEQSKWKKYPENKPENQHSYLVTVKIAIAAGGYIYPVHKDYYQLHGFVHNDHVVAFRELPAPYQEGK